MSDSVDVNISQPLTLSCVAIGYPLLTFSWTKNGQLIQPNNTEGITMTTVPYINQSEFPLLDDTVFIHVLGRVGQLQFNSLEREDTATYTCIATVTDPSNNQILQDESGQVNITVLGELVARLITS